MIENAVIGYLDILGYKKLITQHHSNVVVIQDIEKILRSAAGLSRKFKMEPFNDIDHENYVSKILGTIKVRFISDSVLFTLNLSKITFKAPDSVEDKTPSYCMRLYFQFVSGFCTLFMAKTGLALRGGISIGPHYEKDHNDSGINSLFIFSKAYVNAVALEKEANVARIIIDDKLLKFLKSDISFNVDDWTYRDDDAKNCFEIYGHLRNYPVSEIEKVLTDIRKAVLANIISNMHEPKILSKLMYFVAYHNKKIGKDEWNLPRLLIDFNPNLHTIEK